MQVKDEPEIWKKLKECECVRKVFVRPEDGDLVIYRDTSTLIFHRDTMYDPGNLIWIPPLYDPIRPERSLWEIMKSLVIKLNEGWSDEIARERWANEVVGKIAGSSTRPDLALAKAIIEQEGR